MKECSVGCPFFIQATQKQARHSFFSNSLKELTSTWLFMSISKKDMIQANPFKVFGAFSPLVEHYPALQDQMV